MRGAPSGLRPAPQSWRSTASFEPALSSTELRERAPGSPALCPVCALLACVPLGPRPWLHRLRRRLPGIVRRLRGYYGGVRVPTVVHHRLRLPGFPMRTGAARERFPFIDPPSWSAWPLGGAAKPASSHARVCDHGGSSGRSRMARPCVWPSTFGTVSARDDRSFAVRWLACALPCRRFAGALTDVCARLGADADRYSFTVRDLHPLLLAGLPAHSENLHTTPKTYTLVQT